MAILFMSDDLADTDFSNSNGFKKKIVNICVYADATSKEFDLLLHDPELLPEQPFYDNFNRIPQCGDPLVCQLETGDLYHTGMYATSVKSRKLKTVPLETLQTSGDLPDGYPLLGRECPDLAVWHFEVCFDSSYTAATPIGEAECVGIETDFEDIPSNYDADGKLVQNAACDILAGFTLPVAITKYKFCLKVGRNLVPPWLTNKNGAVNEDDFELMGETFSPLTLRLVVPDIDLTVQTDEKTGAQFHKVQYELWHNPHTWVTRLANAGYTFKKYLSSCEVIIRDENGAEQVYSGPDADTLEEGDTTADGDTVIEVRCSEEVPPVVQVDGVLEPNPDIDRIRKCNIADELKDTISSPQLLDSYGRILDPNLKRVLLNGGSTLGGTVANVAPVLPMMGDILGYGVQLMNGAGSNLDLSMVDPDDMVGVYVNFTCTPTIPGNLFPYVLSIPINLIPTGSTDTIQIQPEFKVLFDRFSAGDTCLWSIDDVGASLFCWRYPRTEFTDCVEVCPWIEECLTFSGDFPGPRLIPEALETLLGAPDPLGKTALVQFDDGVGTYEVIETADGVVDDPPDGFPDLAWVYISFEEGAQKV